jgi:hypothetical protein
MVLMHEFASPHLMVRSGNKGSALEEGLPTRSSGMNATTLLETKEGLH